MNTGRKKMGAGALLIHFMSSCFQVFLLKKDDFNKALVFDAFFRG
jgi:hypothetical protein